MFTDDQLNQYIKSHTTPEDSLLTQVERDTHQHVLAPRMVSGHIQGAVLQMLSMMIRPKRILEIGTFTGYSALCLARGLDKDGILHTIEIDDELEYIYAKYFAQSTYAQNIKYHIGDAREIMTTLNETFDLVFLDGDKRQYTEYYNILMDNNLVKSGGYIFADNVLWSGKVVETVKSSDKQTLNILEFNELVLKDERVENVILPIRDGMNIIRVK
ncbi:MAG: O-methyltransferase [Rikenellaceae bacterium]|nr:O-methyltransferase [Rikenellaceae bacterium]MBO7212939.1 O-methyltransferase [Rikenellaceae bacterium]